MLRPRSFLSQNTIIKWSEIAKTCKLNAFEIKTKEDINKTLKEAFKDRGQKMNEMYPFKTFKEESNEED